MEIVITVTDFRPPSSKKLFNFPLNILLDIFGVFMLFYSYFRHCNYSQYYNDSMSKLCNNYES